MQQTSQMEAPVYYYSTGECSRRPGLPPSHPNNPQVMFASRPHLSPNSSSSSHYRSLPPSSVFDTLPSWTPMNNMLNNNNNNNNNNNIFINNYHYNQYHEPSSSSPTFVGVDQSLASNVVPRVEGRAGDSHGLSATPPLPLGGGSFLRRKGHRRSVSDTPLGLSAMIASSPQLMSRGESSVSQQSANVEGTSEDEIVEDLMSEYLSMEDIDVFTFSGNERELDSGGSVSENEVDSRSLIGGVDGVGWSKRREGVKRMANEDVGQTAGHYRSVSMDSYLEFLNFADDDVARGVPVQAQVAPFSLGTSLVDERIAMLRMKWEGEFCEADLRKIVVNDKLTRIALEDPRHAKRILANRLSAARSKERKVRYITELEQKVNTLLAETDTLSTKNTTLQKDSAGVSKVNKELKFRLEAMEQEAKLKNALNESLTSELERLRRQMDEMTELSSYLLQQLSFNNQILQNHCQQSIPPNIYQLQQQQQDLLPYQLQQQQRDPQPIQLQQQQQDFQANQFQPELQNGVAAIAE